MLSPSMLLAGLVLITTPVPPHTASSSSALPPQPALVLPAAPDLHIRVQAQRATRDPVFEETESILLLAPAQQVEWARAYASGAGRRASAVEIEAAIRRRFPNDPPGMHAQIKLLLLQIMMGDVIAAVRGMMQQQDADLRQFSRLLADKLDEIRRARSTVIRNFARQRPPRAYGGGGPASAARAQDRAARYTQFVQMNTQLMGELQVSERELIAMLETMNRDLQSPWQAYASMRDSDFRSNERVITR